MKIKDLKDFHNDCSEGGAGRALSVDIDRGDETWHNTLCGDTWDEFETEEDEAAFNDPEQPLHEVVCLDCNEYLFTAEE